MERVRRVEKIKKVRGGDRIKWMRGMKKAIGEIR